MSSGQKAVWDDENDWIEFMRSVDILNKVTWDAYSPEARFAREYAAIYIYKINSNILIALVNSRAQVQDAQDKHEMTLKKLLEVNNLIKENTK